MKCEILLPSRKSSEANLEDPKCTATMGCYALHDVNILITSFLLCSTCACTCLHTRLQSPNHTTVEQAYMLRMHAYVGEDFEYDTVMKKTVCSVLSLALSTSANTRNDNDIMYMVMPSLASFQQIFANIYRDAIDCMGFAELCCKVVWRPHLSVQAKWEDLGTHCISLVSTCNISHVIVQLTSA